MRARRGGRERGGGSRRGWGSQRQGGQGLGRRCSDAIPFLRLRFLLWGEIIGLDSTSIEFLIVMMAWQNRIGSVMFFRTESLGSIKSFARERGFQTGCYKSKSQSEDYCSFVVPLLTA